MNTKTSQLIKAFRRFAGRMSLFGGLLVCAATAGATTVTWTGSAGDGRWATATNWDTGAVPGSTDIAVFGTVATITLGADITVSNIQFNADITFTGTKTINVCEVGGSGAIILASAGLRNYYGVALTITNNIVIAANGTQDSWATANAGAIYLKGNLSGNGIFFCYSDVNSQGVHFVGDNHEFTGTIKIHGSRANRVKFDTATSGSSNATFYIYGSTADNSSTTFDGGTIYFGALNTENGQMRGGSGTTLEIGGLNTDCTIGDFNFFNSAKILRKVGTGTLSCHAYNYAGLELVNGTFVQTSPNTANIPSSYLTFFGGTYSWSGSAIDVSSKIKNSTSPIAIDTGTTNIIFATALASSNAGGLTKKGSGTLTLSAKPAYTGITTVEAGTLAVPVGTAFETLAITNGASLSFAGNPLTWTNGATIALFTCSSLVGTTNIVITGLGARASVAYDFTTTPGTCLAVISNDRLVWAGTDGDDWSGDNKWVALMSQEATTFQNADSVILNDTALGNSPATNSINLSTAVNPSLVTVNVSAGHGYKLTGEAITGDSVALKKTGDGILILTNAANAFAGDVAVDGGELVVQSPLTGGITNNATLRLASATPVMLRAVSGSGVTYVDSGMVFFQSALAQPLTNNGIACLTADQTLSQSIAGSGVQMISNATVVITNEASLAQTTGRLTLLPGATLRTQIGNNQADVTDPFGASSLILALKGGSIDLTYANNLTMHYGIIIEADTTNTLNNQAARSGAGQNVNVNGPLSGSGVLKTISRQRGVKLAGDNSAFSGEFFFDTTGNNLSSGFYSAASGSADATWNLTSQNGTADDFYFSHAADSTLNLGAFNVTQPKALMWISTSGSRIAIGAKNEDCAIEGIFRGNALALAKVGEAKLTLGTNFSCVAGSTIAVSNGTLEVNALALSNGTITVAVPAALAGSGTISNAVTLADGATLAPGASGIGTLTFNVAPVLSGKLNFALAVTDGVATSLASPGFDLSNVKLSLASGTLDASKTYTLMTGAGFTGKPDISALPVVNGRTWQVAVTANAVVLSSSLNGTLYRFE